MVFIYVLKLKNNKYYIGKTTNPKIRLDTHFDSNGSKWTQKYTPLNIQEIIPDCEDFDEDKYTLKYMNKYGIDNVRGGSFCELRLTNKSKEMINKMINSSTDKCKLCGQKGHFSNNCKQKSKSQNETKWECDYCGKLFDTKNGATFHENIHCKIRKQIKGIVCKEVGKYRESKSSNIININSDESEDDSDDIDNNDCLYECKNCNCEIYMSEKKKHDKSCKRKYNKYVINCESESESDTYDNDADNMGTRKFRQKI